MAKERISQRTVSKLGPGQTLWDDVVRGFGVRRQKHTPVYVLKYRFKGRQRFMTIGPHGSPWSPEDARQEAKRLLGVLASKENPRDPAEERDRAENELTFSQMASRYLADFADAHKKPRSAAEDERNLRIHVLPVLGSKRLSDITPRDIAAFLASRRDIPIAANRCLGVISHIFSTAEKWAIRPRGENPCRGIDRFQERARERLLSDDEIQRLGATLRQTNPIADEERNAQCSEDWRSVCCIWLLILTGARLGEILSLEWSWIQWERGIARLPDSKTGTKSLPLPEPALSLLGEMRKRASTEYSDSRYILPGNKKGGHFIGIQKAWQRIRTRAGLADVRLHDLRHCYASTAVAAGESLYIVGTILGHQHATTTQRYAHLASAPIREAANRNAKRLVTLLQTSPCAKTQS